MNETHQDGVLACLVPAALQPLERRLAHSRCSVLLNGRSLFGQDTLSQPHPSDWPDACGHPSEGPALSKTPILKMRKLRP